MGMEDAYFLPRCWAVVLFMAGAYSNWRGCFWWIMSLFSRQWSSPEVFQCTFSSTVVHISITSIHKQCTPKPQIFFLAQTHSSRFYLQTQQLWTFITITIFPSIQLSSQTPSSLHAPHLITKSIHFNFELSFDFTLNFPFTYINIWVKPWLSLIETLPPSIQHILAWIIFLSKSKCDHISFWVKTFNDSYDLEDQILVHG